MTIRLHSVAGDGVLARYGDLIVLLSAPAEAMAAVDDVIAAHTAVAATGGDGTALADRLGDVANGRGLDIVAFAPSAGSLVVTVFGHAWAIVTTEHGEQRLALKNAKDGVRSALPGSVLAIRAGLGDVDLDAPIQRWSDLSQGTVRAGGLLLAVADELPASAVPAVDAPASSEDASAAAAPGAPLEPPAAQPAAPPAAPPAATPVAAVAPSAEAVPIPAAMPDPEPVRARPQPVAQPAPPPSVAEPVAVAPEPAAPEPVGPPPEPVAPEPVAPEPVAPEPVAPEPAPAAPEPLAPAPAPSAAPDAGPPQMAPVSAPDVDVDRSQPFSSVSLFSPASFPTEDLEEARAPLPIATRPEAPPIPDAPVPAHPVADDHVEVIGVYCKNGHFDDPSARYCAICGISMAQQTLLPRRGPRPPLGVLVLDDGSIFSLDTDYVIGRDPARDPDVVSGAARPLRIEDPEGLLSRVHARIHLDGWSVNVVDLGSANGTGIWGPQDTAWQRAPVHTATPVRPGTQVGVGRRQMRYESHRNT